MDADKRSANIDEKATRDEPEDTKKGSRTDWKRVKVMGDEQIDLSDAPELDAVFFEEAVVWPAQKKQITLRVDPDVLVLRLPDGH